MKKTVFNLTQTNSTAMRKITLLKASLAFVCVLASQQLSAQYLSMRDPSPKLEKTVRSQFQVTVNPINSLTFKVVINNPYNELLTVTLKDEQGKVYQDDIFYRRLAYGMNLDMLHLEDGIYTLQIIAKSEVFSQTFKVSTEDVSSKNGQMIVNRKAEIL